MVGSLLRSAYEDNAIFFSEEGFSQLVTMAGKLEETSSFRCIFSRIENVEDPMHYPTTEHFQAQIVVQTKDLPSWFSRETKIIVEDCEKREHHYYHQKVQEDDMLGRTHIWLKKIGTKEDSENG